MEEIRTIVEQVKSGLQEGKSEEEIFQSLSYSIGKDPEIAGQIAEQLATLPHEKVANILYRMLKVSSEKKVQKIIKRSLYRLKSNGIDIEKVLTVKESPVFKPLQVEPPKGFGGGFDLLGQRFLMLVIPHTARGWTVMQGVISDTLGWIDFSGMEMTRKGFRGFFEEIQKGSPFPLVEMEASYVGFLFIQTYQLTLRKDKSPPQDYLRLKSEIEGIKKGYEKSLIYSYIQEDEIEGDDRILGRGGELLHIDHFTHWRIGEEEIKPYADEVWGAEESKIILNQAQKEARFQEIYQRALSELFPEERKFLYQRRMEEMAYLLLKLGREEEARISLAVALDLKKPPNLIQPNPFLFQLVIKSILTVLSEAYERKKKELSLIVKP